MGAMGTATLTHPTASALGRLLRQWRSARGLSQLELALRAQVSARHLSFIETGRAQPGREVVLRLARALDLPLRDCNAALTAAGYAQIYRQASLQAPGMEPISRALEFMLRQQEPYPAMVVDRLGNLLRVNRAARRFFELFLGSSAGLNGALSGGPPGGGEGEPPNNIIRLVLGPGWLKPFIANWDEVARLILLRVRRDVGGDPPGSEGGAFLDSLLALPGLPPGSEVPPPPEATALPLVPTEFHHGQRVFRLFTTLTTFGTPQDVTLQELRLESSFPADDATDALLREMAGGAALCCEDPADGGRG